MAQIRTRLKLLPNTHVYVGEWGTVVWLHSPLAVWNDPSGWCETGSEPRNFGAETKRFLIDKHLHRVRGSRDVPTSARSADLHAQCSVRSPRVIHISKYLMHMLTRELAYFVDQKLYVCNEYMMVITCTLASHDIGWRHAV